MFINNDPPPHCTRFYRINAQFTFVEKPQLKINILKHGDLIPSGTDTDPLKLSLQSL